MPAVTEVIATLRGLPASECAARDNEPNIHQEIRPGGVALVAVQNSNNTIWFAVACNDLADRYCTQCNAVNPMAVMTKNTQHHIKHALFYRCQTFNAGVQCSGNVYSLYDKLKADQEMSGANPPGYINYTFTGV